MRKAVHYLGKALRETGQAVDRFGLRAAESEIFNESFSRHRPIMRLFDKEPILAGGVFVAPNATVVGEVRLNDQASVWYGAVVRGDKAPVDIGVRVNIQDRAVISTVSSLGSGYKPDVWIGNYTTIGHGALLTSCSVGETTLIGQGAVIGQGADIGGHVIIAAGAVVLPDTVVPNRQLWAGNPAQYVRDVTEDEVAAATKSSDLYADLAADHDGEFLPYGTVYQHAEKVGAI